MRYRIKEIKEPFRRRKVRVQTSWIGLIWVSVIDSHELPVEFESIEKARAWIREHKQGTMVKVHEQ